MFRRLLSAVALTGVIFGSMTCSQVEAQALLEAPEANAPAAMESMWSPVITNQQLLNLPRSVRTAATDFVVQRMPFGSLLARPTAAAQPPRDGWYSANGYAGLTPVQKAIVANAKLYENRTSGPSYVNKQWDTDCSDNDGDRMRKAINWYDSWKSAPRGRSLDTVKAEMRAKFSGSKYLAPEVKSLVEHIVPTYELRLQHDKKVNLPTDDQSTLLWMDIRKQCFEWSNTVAKVSGGQVRSYSTSGVASAAAWRPGMGLYFYDAQGKGKHAALITDIYYQGGQVKYLRVTEANFGTDWGSNPLGQIPWLRMVSSARDKIAPGSGRVINFE